MWLMLATSASASLRVRMKASVRVTEVLKFFGNVRLEVGSTVSGFSAYSRFVRMRQKLRLSG